VVDDARFLKPLASEQGRAADPANDVWLSASAGTGKTQVLAARVLRLLLRPDVKPEAILCLTFTKAGATEMAERINGRLANWVGMKDAEISTDLRALGEDFGPEIVRRARTLFASVLDARGGGLRIQTIHSFCQTMLAGFPAEAGLTPGFKLIDPREEAALPRKVLAAMTVAAERGGRLGDMERLQTLGRQLDEDRVIQLLIRCAEAPDAMERLPGGEGLAPWLRIELCGMDDVEGSLIALCTDPMPIRFVLDEYVALNRDWGTATGAKHAAIVEDWLARSPDERVATLAGLEGAWLTTARELRVGNPKSDVCQSLRIALHSWCDNLVQLKISAQQAAEIAVALSVGRDFARAYADAKRFAGLVDYDDLIRATVALLAAPGMGDWIRYKLDQATDHVLIDEAQDTNDNQWAIIKSIAGEFFSGEGARDGVHRTLFTVGDYKQAIFSFQGTDPEHFKDAQRHFAEQAEGAGRALLDLSLSQSFRSTPPVLDLVDVLIEDLGGDALGLDDRPPRHVSFAGGGGAITLMPPVSAAVSDEAAEDDEGEGDHVRKLAGQIARQVRSWIDAGLWLEKPGRPIQPRDVLILVRSRGTLASLIVAALHDQRVEVAGLDRLRLNLPLVVQDLLACIRFVLAPQDDLNLASLLVSPLIGWSQQELFDRAHRRPDRLWKHLGKMLGEEDLAPLRAMLNDADLSTPYRFLENILSGEMDGRRKLLGRLGDEARDPIDELLSAALEFERNHPPLLQTFIDWLDRGDVDIKRDPSARADAVRVMTAHGAKGLQAPIVILADAAAAPRSGKGGEPLDWRVNGGLTLPVTRPRRDELSGTLKLSADAADAAAMAEHWRLMYVAVTRAEERLVVAGALGPRARGVVPEDSWYQRIDRALMTMGVAADEDGRKHYEVTGKRIAKSMAAAPDVKDDILPAWLHQRAPEEARPPRPLAPSALGRDNVSDPPPTNAMRDAAERGRLLHGLFERLPGVSRERRAAAGERWLAGSGGLADPGLRTALVADALAIIDDPAFADVFAADALAEAPIAGVVDGVVVAGTVDRLLVTKKAVRVVDFKTGRRVPRSIDAVSPHHLRQMAAYVATLEVIFPDRPVTAALLYTSGPVLHVLPADLIETYKRNLQDQQQVLGAAA
jgi:ATP-dependent helicase/nuclease subunit A